MGKYYRTLRVNFTLTVCQLKAVIINHMSTYTWDIVIIANPFRQQPVSDFPRKYRRTLSLEFGDLVNNRLCRDSWFGTADGSRFYRTRFIIPAKEKTTQTLLQQ